jgi:thymidylate synthase (FAD)
VAREQARKDLPLCTYTEAYWKIDLHNLLHFLALRMDPHAQKEIRDYATVIGEQIVARWVPLTWEAFCDYRLGAVYYSRIEHEIMAAAGAGDTDAACAIAREAGWLKPAKSGGWLRHRERQELEAKLQALNLDIPW